MALSKQDWIDISAEKARADMRMRMRERALVANAGKMPTVWKAKDVATVYQAPVGTKKDGFSSAEQFLDAGFLWSDVITK